jgi:hypothetical protein
MKGFRCSVMGTSRIERTTPSSPFARRSECLMISAMFLLSGMLILGTKVMDLKTGKQENK